MLKNQKGITITVLVITIIVLFIILGITFTTANKKNGIIVNTNNSIKIQNQTTAKEEIELAWAASFDELENAPNNEKPEILKKYFDRINTKKATIVVSLPNGETNKLLITYTLIGDNDKQEIYQFELNSRGKATLIE